MAAAGILVHIFIFLDNEKFLLYSRSSRYANVLDILDDEKIHRLAREMLPRP
jgi:hypothetical protein